jgi:tetratricopeptide (TPR) repeat protein
MRDFIKFNGETTERLYLLSHFYSAAANDDAAVAALQRVLSIMPDNIGANNDLGYFWANAGIHLDQAEPMIRKALENRPDDPAFMDSLGWVYYKQGKFSEAMDLIQKAASLPGGNDPEVLQHLGDTMYRLGRGPDAIEKWKQALQQIRIADHQTAADRKKQEYLSKVVNDAQAGNTPAVSATIDTDAAKSATPATAPMLLNPEPMPSLKQ